jgi:hypothetical protein
MLSYVLGNLIVVLPERLDPAKRAEGGEASIVRSLHADIKDGTVRKA